MGSEVEEGAAGIISIDRSYAGISVSLICLSGAWIPVHGSIYSAWSGRSPLQAVGWITRPFCCLPPRLPPTLQETDDKEAIATRALLPLLP